ncbi:MAG TPA: hypothetical protein PKN50_16620 [Spirochaetota bacterium]|mgnify:CR=1 FL=1|nr:hypothetical protein [Spirochaetota bacterium]HPV42910.1 hypothetical protein [Spirochaetota bacterium]
MIHRIKSSLGPELIKRADHWEIDLSPINFLYYGVPAESMDSIISQLTKLSLGIVGRYRN